MSETDTFYIHRCLDGHPDDYRFLVKRYQGALRGHLVGKTGNRDLAEDVTQESFVRAYFKIDTLMKPESYFSWLMGIADRVTKEFLKKEQMRKQRNFIRAAVEQAPCESLSKDYSLEEAISRLPEKYRQMVLLRYYSQMPCKQIAEHLSLPIGTVTKTLSRAYVQLRKTLTPSESLNESEVSS